MGRVWKVTTCGMHATLLATERFMTKPPAEPEPREHHLHNDIPGQTTAPLSSPALIITSIIITSIIITSDNTLYVSNGGQQASNDKWAAALSSGHSVPANFAAAMVAVVACIWVNDGNWELRLTEWQLTN